MSLQSGHADDHVKESAHGSVEEFNGETDHCAVRFGGERLELNHSAQKLISNRSGGNDMIGGFNGLVDTEQVCPPASEADP